MDSKLYAILAIGVAFVLLVSAVAIVAIEYINTMDPCPECADIRGIFNLSLVVPDGYKCELNSMNMKDNSYLLVCK